MYAPRGPDCSLRDRCQRESQQFAHNSALEARRQSCDVHVTSAPRCSPFPARQPGRAACSSLIPACYVQLCVPLARRLIVGDGLGAARQHLHRHHGTASSLSTLGGRRRKARPCVLGGTACRAPHTLRTQVAARAACRVGEHVNARAPVARLRGCMSQGAHACACTAVRLRAYDRLARAHPAGLRARHSLGSGSF